MRLPKYLVVGMAVSALSLGTGFVAHTYAAQTTDGKAVVVSDSDLKDRVKASIKAQPTLKNQNIDVDVANKVVTLSGAVQTSTRKARAEQAAHVAGVTQVVNNLKIDANANQNMAGKAEDATKTAAVKTGEAAKVVGEKTKEGVSETGEVITDAWINSRIHSQMVDEASLKGSDVNVDVVDHVVTLKGTVMSAAGKARAEAIAQKTEGVKAVHNMLTIGPKK